MSFDAAIKKSLDFVDPFAANGTNTRRGLNNILSPVHHQGLNFTTHGFPPTLMLNDFLKAGGLRLRGQRHDVSMMRVRYPIICDGGLNGIRAR